MKRLWRRRRSKREGNSTSRGGGNNNENEEIGAQTGGNFEEKQREQGTSSDDGRGVEALAGRSPSLDSCHGEDRGRIDGDDVGDGGSDCDVEMMDGMEDEEGCQAVDRSARSRSLFDEILDQNAIPTIRQNSELVCLWSCRLQLWSCRSI